MYKTRKQDKIQESIQSKKNEVQGGASKKMRGRALIQKPAHGDKKKADRRPQLPDDTQSPTAGQTLGPAAPGPPKGVARATCETAES